MARASIKPGAKAKDMTASVQDYLAAVYDLTSSGKPVIGARLAKHMSISAPAVTEAIHRMARGGDGRVGRTKPLTPPPQRQQIAEGMAPRHPPPQRSATETPRPHWAAAPQEA